MFKMGQWTYNSYPLMISLLKRQKIPLDGEPPFDLPYTIYINILRNLKGLGGLNGIYYVVPINKLLWDQEVYHVFNKMDEDSKHTLIVKGSVVAKQFFL